jgi:hypothetical protein
MASLAAFLSAAPFHAAWAQTAPSLGAASEFSVLGGTAVTCTTSSVVIGDVGVFPGTAFTNTVCMVAGRTPPATRAAAEQARTDFLNAYAAFRQFTSCTQVLGNLAGARLGPGVYCVDDVAKAGTLTLTGQSNGVWIFLVDGATGALTGTNFSVVMEGGGQPCNVFWAPRAAATMTNSALKGNILAGNATLGSITLTGGTLAGRALANVAVTMTDASLIGCGASGALLSSLSCKGKERDGDDEDKEHRKCNQGVGNDSEDCDPGHSDRNKGSNDERGGTPGNPDRKGGNNK